MENCTNFNLLGIKGQRPIILNRYLCRCLKTLSLAILLCIFFIPVVQAQKNVILDTDMGPDCDDALALSILHVMADKGEANILAVGSCVSDPYSAPTIDVINTYYGRPNIPVGALKQVGILAGPYFTREIAQEFPNDILNGRNAPDVISVYR